MERREGREGEGGEGRGGRRGKGRKERGREGREEGKKEREIHITCLYPHSDDTEYYYSKNEELTVQ